MNQFDAGKCDVDRDCGLEAEHGSDASFDTVMILFNGVVHVFTGQNSDRVRQISVSASMHGSMQCIRFAFSGNRFQIEVSQQGKIPLASTFVLIFDNYFADMVLHA